MCMHHSLCCRLVSSVTEMEVRVRQAVEFHSRHNSILLVRDPHYQVCCMFAVHQHTHL